MGSLSRRTDELPGAQRIERALLDRAVHDINRIHNQKGLELALALGSYVLRTFFAGSLTAFSEHQRSHQTFRALARRSDLQVSHTTLWTAVSIVEQMRQLPERTARQLSYSHHRALLTVKPAGDKLRLARRVVDDRLTTRQLDSLVREWASKQSGRRTGRPRVPTVVKGIQQVDTAVQRISDDGVDETWLASRPPDELQELLERVEQSVAALGQVTEVIQRYVGSPMDEA